MISSYLSVRCACVIKADVYDPARIFGVCTQDIVRANTYVATIKGLNPRDVHVPVIGGHCGVTTVPVVSQSKPTIIITEEEFKSLAKTLQQNEKVVQYLPEIKFQLPKSLLLLLQ